VKLLFDQNLSRHLTTFAASLFPGSGHVKDFGLVRESDDAIWSFAARHGFAIVTKDSDFIHRALLLGPPPKVIHMRVGNCPTGVIERLLRDRAGEIRRFLSDPVESLLTMARVP